MDENTVRDVFWNEGFPMFDEKGWFEFAAVLTIVPTDRGAALLDRLLVAPLPPGLQVDLRSPTLMFFVIEEWTEFGAVAKAEKWVRHVAGSMSPPVSVRFNAQPSQFLS
ncbi:MAG: hypothetical protein ACKO5K_02080 [Armatimonadota bacterium]